MDKSKINKALFVGATALMFIFTIQDDNKSSATVEDSIVLMNADTEIENGTAVFSDAGTQGIVMEEKKAEDPAYIFYGEKTMMYASRVVDLKAEPKEGSDIKSTLDKGQEVTTWGKNEEGYYRVIYSGQELYAEGGSMAADLSEVFYDCDYEAFATAGSRIYEDIYAENIISEIDKGEKIHVIGENHTDFLYISHGDLKGYINKESITTIQPGEVHIVAGEHPTTDLYVDNIYDGMLAEIPESEVTEENIIFLAKLINCEAGGQTEDGKLAVGTVVVNRLNDGYWGDTIRDVIEAKSQFSPVSSGKIYSASYTEDDYECARKVLVDGYRSFPAYVMYFQSIREGYFKDNTYCICRTENGTFPQYFSYKASDLKKYGSGTLTYQN